MIRLRAFQLPFRVYNDDYLAPLFSNWKIVSVDGHRHYEIRLNRIEFPNRNDQLLKRTCEAFDLNNLRDTTYGVRSASFPNALHSSLLCGTGIFIPN